MMLRLGFTAGLDLDDVTVVGHMPVIDMGHCAAAALALPGSQLDLRQARKIKIFVNLYAFPFEPFRVRIGFVVVFEPVFGRLRHFHIGA